eukprot:scaffold306519_cov14-Tisochrysis_lutea.AAC.1
MAASDERANVGMWATTFFCTILSCNLLGLIPFNEAPTSGLGFATGLGISTWATATALGFYKLGFTFPGHFIPGSSNCCSCSSKIRYSSITIGLGLIATSSQLLVKARPVAGARSRNSNSMEQRCDDKCESSVADGDKVLPGASAQQQMGPERSPTVVPPTIGQWRCSHAANREGSDHLRLGRVH